MCSSRCARSHPSLSSANEGVAAAAATLPEDGPVGIMAPREVEEDAPDDVPSRGKRQSSPSRVLVPRPLHL